MRTPAKSQTTRKPILILTLALLLFGAPLVIQQVLESWVMACGSQATIDQKRETATEVRQNHPKKNPGNRQTGQKQTEKPKRSILRHQVVNFASNRQWVKDANGRPVFGKQPGPTLVLGRAHTVVGDGYQPGDLTDISIESLAIQENPDDLNALFPDPNAKSKPVLVFVHGFRVEFEEAIQRVTQIVHELDYDGHVFLYTWPSVFELTFEAYVQDQNAIDASVKSCCLFLGNLADHFGGEKVQILAHSLGCRLIAKTIQSLLSEESAGKEKIFQNLIFAAPDIELDNFKQSYLPALKVAARRVTIYFSSKDGDLALAESLDRRPPRLGRKGLPLGSHPLAKLVEFVDYSPLGGWWTMKTHNLYREHPAMVHDLRGVLSGSISSSHRKLGNRQNVK